MFSSCPWAELCRGVWNGKEQLSYKMFKCDAGEQTGQRKLIKAGGVRREKEVIKILAWQSSMEVFLAH